MNKKIVKQLAQKKYRQELGLFLVQGRKSVDELITSAVAIEHLYCTNHYANERDLSKYSVTIVSNSELLSLGTLEENDAVIAVVAMRALQTHVIKKTAGPVLYLDAIRDPGNLGTIIRTADWFGVQTLYVSPDTVDFYNAKSIAASMGSFTRVTVATRTHEELVTLAKDEGYSLAVLTLEGTNMYTTEFNNKTIFVMGSESHGVSKDLQDVAEAHLTIPKFGDAESLNVAIATSVVLSEYRRRGL